MLIGMIIKNKDLNNYENIKFREEAKKLKINLELLNIEEFSVKIDQKIKILYQGQELKNFDCLVNRLGSGCSRKYGNIIDTISCKYRVINNGEIANLLKDKYKTLLKLQQNDIPIIPTMISQKNYDLIEIKNNLELPIIKKSNVGTIGKGIYKVDNEQNLIDMLDFADLLDKKYFYILQEYIGHKPGEDIRIIMYKDKLIGAIKRKAKDDFKANYTIHQQGESYEVNDKVLKLAQKIMKVLKCDIAGIDLLETKDGFVVCEVNSAPGFVGMDNLNPGLNTANKILYHIINDEN